MRDFRPGKGVTLPGTSLIPLKARRSNYHMILGGDHVSALGAGVDAHNTFSESLSCSLYSEVNESLFLQGWRIKVYGSLLPGKYSLRSPFAFSLGTRCSLFVYRDC